MPNATAALAKQSELMGKGNLGPYDLVNNSCVSHVCDVLDAGGFKTPSPNGTAQIKFLRKTIKSGGYL